MIVCPGIGIVIRDKWTGCASEERHAPALLRVFGVVCEPVHEADYEKDTE